MALDLTERERSIATFALQRFALEARDIHAAMSEKRARGQPIAPAERAKFLQDAKDAEALIARLRADRYDPTA